MGWSFAVTCRSKKAQSKMLDFLREHYIPTSRLYPWWKPTHWRVNNPKMPSPYTKYAQTKTSIGFDSPTEHEQAVLRWVALKVGKKRTFKKKLGADSPAVPWVNMDGTSAPVILRPQWDGREENEQYIVDDIGFRPLNRQWVGDLLRADEEDKLIRDDLERLDALWKNGGEA